MSIDKAISILSNGMSVHINRGEHNPHATIDDPDRFSDAITRVEEFVEDIEAWARTPVYENDSVLFCTKDASSGYEMAQALVEKILRGDE